MIVLKDANGHFVPVSNDEFLAALINNSETLLGMDVNVIATFRAIYQKKGGPLPMTPKSVQDVLGADPIKKEG